MPLPIAAFQLVGYFAWNEEDAGSNPACYTTRVVGVTANSTDCRSVAMSSLPDRVIQAGTLIRTAVLPDTVMVNISHFDCDVLSSSLSPVTKIICWL
jgi:hypothetical protein